MAHKGSLEFWPHRRAHRPLPRVRNWPVSQEPKISSLVAFKAGMTHVSIIDDSLSPSKGQEVIRPVTVLVFPKVFVYGARLYKRDYLYKQPAETVYDKTLAQRVGIKSPKTTNIEALKKETGKYIDAVALAFAEPETLRIGMKKQVRFEIPVGGKSVEEKLSFIEKLIGKEIKPSETFVSGELVDVVSITKGKGWEGPVKRFGVARQYHKATGKRRHVGTLGAWHPPKVLFSVPQAGHLGYNYRTELNKRILKMGTQQDAATVTPNGGFLDFGNLNGDYIVLDGSIPGIAKRLVRIRKALRAKQKVTSPKITYISTTSKQGA